MILLGIDIYQSDEAFSCDGITYPVGTYIIPMTQAFALFIKNVFEEQSYPDLRKYPDLWQGLVRSRKYEGSPFESYDMMGWTLPYQFGANVISANSPLKVKMTLRKEIKPAPGEILGSPKAAFLIGHETNASFTATNRIIKAGGKVLWAKKSFSLQNKSFPEGTIIVPAQSVNYSFMEKLAKELNLKISGVSEMPKIETYTLKKPKVAIYQSWISSADEGWTRFILEQHELPFTSIFDADIRAGNLNANYDVIIIPEARSPESVINGYAKGTMPPKYIGGITLGGLRNLKLFADNGGSLIFMNSISDLAIDHFGIPVRNVLKQVKSEEFVCSGSILRMEFDPSHPLAYGMPKEGAAVFSDSCAFDIMPSFEAKKEPKSVAKYAAENLLMSGWIYGEKLIQKKSSILNIPYGKGKLILFGFPVQLRGQPYATFKLLFNAIYYGAISE
jgi:hypothetical protein